MRKKIVLFSSLVILVFAAFLIISHKQETIIKRLEIKNIKSMEVSPASVGLNVNGVLYFDLNKKEHLDMVNNILNWLKTGKVIGKPNAEYFAHSYTPTCLQIELKNGRMITIVSSVDVDSVNLGNQLLVKPKDVPDQVTICFDSNDPERILSPQLKSFINDGWKSFFNYSQE